MYGTIINIVVNDYIKPFNKKMIEERKNKVTKKINDVQLIKTSYYKTTKKIEDVQIIKTSYHKITKTIELTRTSIIKRYFPHNSELDYFKKYLEYHKLEGREQFDFYCNLLNKGLNETYRKIESYLFCWNRKQIYDMYKIDNEEINFWEFIEGFMKYKDEHEMEIKMLDNGVIRIFITKKFKNEKIKSVYKIDIDYLNKKILKNEKEVKLTKKMLYGLNILSKKLIGKGNIILVNGSSIEIVYFNNLRKRQISSLIGLIPYDTIKLVSEYL